MLALTIANKGPRLTFWQQAQAAVEHERGIVLSYAEAVVPERLNEALLDLKQQAQAKGLQPYVRLESPGEDFSSIKTMIAMGQQTAHIAANDALQLSHERGLIVYPKQWYDGFVVMMQQFDKQFAAHQVPVMNAPRDLIPLFDKRATNHHLMRGQVCIPEVLEEPSNFSELITAMAEQGWGQAFVKVASGSSASGVIALRYSGRGSGKLVAYTTMRLVDRGDGSFGIAGGVPPRIYNSLRIQRYEKENDISFLINYLFSQGAQVQQWLPKAQHRGKNYDLRVLTVGGQAMHTVVRMSRSPMTNLHLGNQRADIDELGLPDSVVQGIYQEAENAAQCFTDCHYLGIDIMLVGRQLQPTIIECNGFGDLLPTARFAGRTTHEQELLEWQQRNHCQ